MLSLPFRLMFCNEFIIIIMTMIINLCIYIFIYYIYIHITVCVSVYHTLAYALYSNNFVICYNTNKNNKKSEIIKRTQLNKYWLWWWRMMSEDLLRFSQISYCLAVNTRDLYSKREEEEDYNNKNVKMEKMVEERERAHYKHKSETTHTTII